MYINTAEQISGIPSSWPGYDLTIGSRGDKVRQIQQQLNRIAKDYPSLPTIAVDGVYGESTANAVRKFQNIFGLPQTGIVDYPTWYKISEIYVGVSRIVFSVLRVLPADDSSATAENWLKRSGNNWFPAFPKRNSGSDLPAPDSSGSGLYNNHSYICSHP